MENESSALERVFKPAEGDLAPDMARRLLDFDFSETDQARYSELSDKAQLGTLSKEEQNELEDLLTANDVLMVLHAKARSSLGQPSSAA
jgi:hypothetical protein